MSIRIAQLKAEQHHSGLGLFHDHPRLSWRFESTTIRNWVQASYEITLRRGDRTESHKVTSAESVLVPWPASPLTSREIVHVQVVVTGRDGTRSNTADLTIEVALLRPSDWQSQFISCPPQPKDEPKRPFRLRKTFKYAGQSASAARLYATALGIYQVEINGKVVGVQLLAPGWQSYQHRLHYQTYDVTSYLTKGENAIGAYVAEGWYAGRLGRPGTSNIWGDRLGFMAQLEIDGEKICTTDASWDYLDGPVVSAEIYNGEIFDTTLNDTAWSTAEAPVEVAGKAEEIQYTTARLIAPDVAPIRRILEIKPKEIITTPQGKKILDFGQNLVGWLKILVDIPGKIGDELLIRHAEVLEHGELGTRPLRTAKAQTIVKLGGQTKGYEPRFSWFGFRYAEINGYDHLSLSDFVAIAISTDLRQTGIFHCSHEMINKLHENTIWSTRDNFVSVPTDCPQRDE